MCCSAGTIMLRFNSGPILLPTKVRANHLLTNGRPAKRNQTKNNNPAFPQKSYRRNTTRKLALTSCASVACIVPILRTSLRLSIALS